MSTSPDDLRQDLDALEDRVNDLEGHVIWIACLVIVLIIVAIIGP